MTIKLRHLQEGCK